MKAGLFKSVLLKFLLFSSAHFICLEFGFLTVQIFSLGRANAAPVPDATLDESSANSAIADDSLVDSETTVVIAEAKGIEDAAEGDSPVAALPTDEALNTFADENSDSVEAIAPPPPVSTAAVTVPAWRSLTPAQSYETEDELIAQMTGAAASDETATDESVREPSAIAIPVPTPGAVVPPVATETRAENTWVAPTAIAPVTPAAVATTTVATSDVGMRLFTPDQSSNTAAISAFEAQQINQVVPSVAASSTPPPTAAPVVSQAAQLMPPGEPLTSQAPANNSLLRSTALTPPSITLQGVYIFQDEESSARARLRALYPITPNLQAGATLDLTAGDALTDSPDDGLSINELYLAASLEDVPNLRFVVGTLTATVLPKMARVSSLTRCFKRIRH